MSRTPTLARVHSPEAAAEALLQDGAVIVEGLLDEATRRAALDELGPWIGRTSVGRNAFYGAQTTRTGAVVARSPAARRAIQHPFVLDVTHRVLSPWSINFQVHLTQVIRLLPGQGSQEMHRDRIAWSDALGAIPGLEPQVNAMWALTDFTAENGATRVAPGSARWPPGRMPEDREVTQAEMPAGSVLLFTGNVVHGGGQNRSQEERIGLNIDYALGWLRQEENQYLSCPPEIARLLEPQLQELIGYTKGSFALGYYSDPTDAQNGGILDPEAALGRRARTNFTAADLHKPAGGDNGPLRS